MISRGHHFLNKQKIVIYINHCVFDCVYQPYGGAIERFGDGEGYGD